MKCKCGKNEAVYNEKLQQYELCDECKEVMYAEMCPKYLIDIGFGDIYKNASLKDFKLDFRKQLIIDTDSFKKNLLLTGDSSVGKTYLMASVCAYLIRHGYSRIDIRFINLIDLLTKSYGEDKYATFSGYSKIKVLLLDEVIPLNVRIDYNILYSLLNERMNRGLVTISSSNYSLDKLNGQIVTRLLANNGVHYEISRRCWSNE
jgi:DNA replication protein DnaC